MMQNKKLIIASDACSCLFQLQSYTMVTCYMMVNGFGLGISSFTSFPTLVSNSSDDNTAGRFPTTKQPREVALFSTE